MKYVLLNQTLTQAILAQNCCSCTWLPHQHRTICICIHYSLAIATNEISIYSCSFYADNSNNAGGNIQTKRNWIIQVQNKWSSLSQITLIILVAAVAIYVS